MDGPREREQQKLYLTPEARTRLRYEAKAQGIEMSALVEELIMENIDPVEETVN